MGRLDGKVVLISGGARGQGALEAELFVAEGARVVFGDVLDDEGQAVERRIAESGGEAIYVHLDVTSDADWEEAVHTAEGRFGRLDVLVNNAGIANDEKIEDTSEELWDRIMQVTSRGSWHRASAALHLAAGPWRPIIKCPQIAGILGRPLTGTPTARQRARTQSQTTAIQSLGEQPVQPFTRPGGNAHLLAGISDNRGGATA